MLSTKRTLIGVIAAATLVLTVLNTGPAQATPGDKSGPGKAAAVDDSRAPDRSAGATSAFPAAESAMTLIQAKIARYVATHGTKYTFGSYVDGTTGKMVVETNAPAAVVTSLTSLSGATSGQRQALGQLQVRRSAISDAYDRKDDAPPFWGGAGLRSGNSLCSSGYAVQNASGTVFATTAGHCYANGATVTTESTNATYGTVSARRLPTVTGHTMDVELIGGQSYSGQIYVGDVNSTTGIPVVAAGEAYVGYTDYCHSGRTSGEQCGHTTSSITGQVCTGTGCKSPVIVYSGGNIGAGGDSGGPFYAKDSRGAWIRGHFIAYSGTTTGYAQPWTVISSELGVSIVTG